MPLNYLQRVAASSAGVSSSLRKAPAAPTLLPRTPRSVMPPLAGSGTEVFEEVLETGSNPEDSAPTTAMSISPGAVHREPPRPVEKWVASTPPLQSALRDTTKPPPRLQRDVSATRITDAHMAAPLQPTVRDATEPPPQNRQSFHSTAAQAAPSIVRAPRGLRSSSPQSPTKHPAPVSEPHSAADSTPFAAVSNFEQQLSTRQSPKPEAEGADWRFLAATSPVKDATPEETPAGVVWRSSSRRGSRIHIGRVEVQVNNIAPPAPQLQAATRAVATMSAIETHFLNRFPIRV